MLAAMKITFLYHPVRDVERAVAFYRDVLGWDESWRMGDATAAMALPGSELTVMLDTDDPQDGAPAGGFFQVDDVDAFHAELSGNVAFVVDPVDLPPIRYAAFTDPDGNLLRIFHELPE